MTQQATAAPGPGRSAFAWLNLVWSVWIFLVPLMEPRAFPGWLAPTLASYAVFLVLFHRVHFGAPRWIPACVAAMALLAVAVTPANPGAQGYLIYACAYLPFCLPPTRSIAAIAALLAAYVGYWLVLSYPWVYVLNAVVVGLAVALMNVHYIRRQQADAALQLSHDEVRRLAALAERERIGRDLHDRLGHTLSLITLKLELARKLHDRDDARAR